MLNHFNPFWKNWLFSSIVWTSDLDCLPYKLSILLALLNSFCLQYVKYMQSTLWNRMLSFFREFFQQCGPRSKGSIFNENQTILHIFVSIKESFILSKLSEEVPKLSSKSDMFWDSLYVGCNLFKRECISIM